jgi:hypothetical protein
MRVDGVDGGQVLVGAGTVPAQAGSDDGVARGDQLGSHLVRSWSGSGTSAPPVTRAARRASVRRISASRPGTSGSSGMSDARIRARLMASAHRSTTSGHRWTATTNASWAPRRGRCLRRDGSGGDDPPVLLAEDTVEVGVAVTGIRPNPPLRRPVRPGTGGPRPVPRRPWTPVGLARAPRRGRTPGRSRSRRGAP